jgi:hypothetical protein
MPSADIFEMMIWVTVIGTFAAMGVLFVRSYRG